MNKAERFDRLDDKIAGGNVCRGVWTDGEHVCLLLALAPECGETESADACPADLVPQWLAELTPWIDDAGTLEHWPDVITRYASVVRRAASQFDAPAWRRCDYRARRAALLEARSAVADFDRVIADVDRVIADVDRVIALCDRVIAGDEPDPQEWLAAGIAADRRERLVQPESPAAATAAYAAYAATKARSRAASDAAGASAAAYIADLELFSNEVADRVKRAVDAIIDGILDGLEAELAVEVRQ